MTPKLPDWTWQLEAGDMCKKSLYRGSKSCLLGWLDKWLEEEIDAADLVYRKLREIGHIGTDIGMGDYNDSHPLDHNARVWNTTMRRLGYDIDEDACL